MNLPNHPIDTIVRDLRALGVRENGVLLVHASLRSLGLPSSMPSRAEVALLGLMDALGPRGTLLMPALSYETVGAHNPVFDVHNTPGCVGALPEAFRLRPGVLRSVHPTHSVCGAGPRAQLLLEGHIHDATPVGPRSPFARLPHEDGQILFLGCGLRPNTSMHGIEERVEPPYLYGPQVDYRIILRDGSETAMRVRSHNFKGWTQRYDRVENVLPEGIARGRVLQADCFLIEASALWKYALEKIQAESLYFVDKD